MRDELIERVGVGNLTPDQAEAEAERRGIGPLVKQPDPGDYDPGTEQSWTIPMAVAWIAYRDLNKVRNWWNAYRTEQWYWRQSQYRAGPNGPTRKGWILEQRERAALPSLGIASIVDAGDGVAMAMSAGEATDTLIVALREGFFEATGVDLQTERRTAIPALDWHELTPVEGRGRVDEVRRGLLGSGYRDVLVPSRAVRGFWKAQQEKLQTAPPPVMPPSGDGYMPLYCAAQWIATEGGTIDFDPDSDEIWRSAYTALLATIASDKVRVVGTRKSEREIVPGHHFADCEVDYPFGSATLETILGEELYLRSYPYIDETHWRRGFDDALMNRRETRWSRLMVAKENIRALWPELPSAAKSGFPGRPSSKHLIMAELERRFSTNEMKASVVEESRILSAWLKATHADMPPAEPKTVEDRIRTRHRELRAGK